ncbi:MAG: hypothetical protein AAGU77_05325 [Bacillota bacterium]
MKIGRVGKNAGLPICGKPADLPISYEFAQNTAKNFVVLLLVVYLNSECRGFSIIGAADVRDTLLFIPGMSSAKFQYAEHRPQAMERRRAEILRAAFEVEFEYFADLMTTARLSGRIDGAFFHNNASLFGYSHLISTSFLNMAFIAPAFSHHREKAGKVAVKQWAWIGYTEVSMRLTYYISGRIRNLPAVILVDRLPNSMYACK